MVGTVYNMQPQPPVAEDTRWLEAGGLTFGVEYRDVDPASLTETYAADEAAMAEMEEHSPEGGFSDEGASIHVCGSRDGHEYLRFDVFTDAPHYHYVRPTGDHNHVVEYDVVANGDMITWALDPTRLARMLSEAGASDLADEVAQHHVHEALREVEELARGALARA